MIWRKKKNEQFHQRCRVNEWFSQQMASLTPMKMVLALLMGFVVGMIISLVYRKAFRGVLFSPGFSTTLIMLCMITTPVVMCIKSNIALSMGMARRAVDCSFPYSCQRPAGYGLYVLEPDHGHFAGG